VDDLIKRVKTILWIVDADYDLYLAEVVPALLEFAKGHCGQSWEVDDVPADVVMFIARATEFHLKTAGMSQEQMGDWSASYTQTLPESILDLLYNHRKVKN